MATIKLYPSTISTVLAWTNPDNAKADDGVYATTGGTRNNNHDIIGSGFDLSSIPDGSTINSVALEVQYKLSTTASAWTGTLLAVKNGSLENGTAITTTTEPTIDTVWQNTGTGSYTKETLAQLGVLFRVRRSSYMTCTYSVDYLAIAVDYTPLTYDVTNTVSDSIGDQYSIEGKKVISNSSNDSIGFQDSIIPKKIIYSQSFNDSIGYNDSLSGVKITTYILIDSYGDNVSAPGIKKINIQLTESIGDQSTIISGPDSYNYSGTTASTIGYQDNLASNKNGKIILTDSIGDQLVIISNKDIYEHSGTILITFGYQDSLAGNKNGKSILSDSIGAQVWVISNKDIYKYSGLVSISFGYQDSLTSNKSFAFSTIETYGTQESITSIKEVKNTFTDQLGDRYNIAIIKAASAEIIISAGGNVFVDGNSIYNAFRSVLISFGYQDNIAGSKSARAPPIISGGYNDQIEIRKDAKLDIISLIGDIGTFVTDKSTGGIIEISAGAQIVIKSKVLGHLIKIYLSHTDFGAYLTFKNFDVSTTFEKMLVDLEFKNQMVKLSFEELIIKMEVEWVSIAENTVKLKAEFKNYNGELVSPDDVVVTIYDGRKVPISSGASALPVSLGVFEYDYTLPSDYCGAIYYEFKGMVDGMPIVGRSKLDVRWVE